MKITLLSLFCFGLVDVGTSSWYGSFIEEERKDLELEHTTTFDPPSAPSCTCEVDEDCNKPVCVKDPYTGQGFCSSQSSHPVGSDFSGSSSGHGDSSDDHGGSDDRDGSDDHDGSDDRRRLEGGDDSSDDSSDGGCGGGGDSSDDGDGDGSSEDGSGSGCGTHSGSDSGSGSGSFSGFLETERGCPCSSDFDCHRRTKCLRDHTGVKKCSREQSGDPEPTIAADEPEEKCCVEPHNIPTECEVEILIEMMDIAIQSNHKLSPQWLRLAFHDAGTHHVGEGVGGANGCLMTYFPMSEQEENGFLHIPISTLEAIKRNWEEHPETCVEVSAADIIQFAGHLSALRQTHNPGLDETKISDLMLFEWGRSDELNCDIAWTDNLPRFHDLIGPEHVGNIPLRCLRGGEEIKEKMMKRNGFSALESVALIGAHTIGLTRNSFGPRRAAPWVMNGADSATPNGPMFDNGYHAYLGMGLAAKDVVHFSVNPAPFRDVFRNWFRDSTSGVPINHLDTDIAIAFPSQNTEIHPDFYAYTMAFAENNDYFLEEFFKALTKMGKLGVNDVLAHPTACDAKCVVNGPDLASDVVITIVHDVGDAESLGEAELTKVLDTEEIVHQVDFSTYQLHDEEIMKPAESIPRLREFVQNGSSDDGDGGDHGSSDDGSGGSSGYGDGGDHGTSDDGGDHGNSGYGDGGDHGSSDDGSGGSSGYGDGGDHGSSDDGSSGSSGYGDGGDHGSSDDGGDHGSSGYGDGGDHGSSGYGDGGDHGSSDDGGYHGSSGYGYVGDHADDSSD